ncbi:MAG TPA: helix-turn-helix domain-containing protein [Terriglobia bacterium]|nr:helix-turn-helix domain-containing protein [Terriglobia bacterium]
MASVSEKYLALIKSFPLRRIKSEAELDKAASVMRALTRNGSDRLSAPEADYLEILGNLIEEYEAKHHPIENLPPHEMLAAAMEARSVNQTEVSKATGIPVSTISELLSQKRDFNVSHVEKLCVYFGLGPSAFIRVGNSLQHA